LEVVQDFVLDLDKVDKWTWKEVANFEFSVKPAYVFLKGDSEGEHRHFFKDFWRIKAFLSAHLVAWRVLKNKIATKVNLARHGIVIEDITCSLCG